MDLVEDLHCLMKRYGEDVKVFFESGFEFIFLLRLLVPEYLSDASTSLRLRWSKENIKVSIEPENGLDNSEGLILEVLNEKGASKKRSFGSILKAINEFFDIVEIHEDDASLHSISSGEQALLSSKLEEEYVVGDELGSGAFGQVLKCFNKLDGEEYVIKVVSFTPEEEGDSLRKELEANRTFEDTEWVKILRELANGLNFIHQQGIINRDLSPDNIFLDSNGVAKIGDFGCAIMLGPGEVNVENPKGGKVMYKAPELSEGSKLDSKCDVFSLGVIMFELVYPMQGFDTQKRVGVLKDLGRGVQPADYVHGTFHDVLMMLLTGDPDLRPSALDVIRTIDLLNQNVDY
ncbi:OLC1v1016870C1 [Oldenlandia corymbosa var. corymbosa]|uniref:OLC1v1016870C1 n=1 Tax=Oldenlandia corymbosa var. corymbosa TaxID=529605 RepID=A0AAV1E855_OLDCO|nr:OLC1v1016870C1 [Oldenlandia corymbosa var. corymbosa]